MRNEIIEICVETETSKLSTRVALLSISILCSVLEDTLSQLLAKNKI